MKSMEISIEEKKEHSMPSAIDTAKYPHGLNLHICEDVFKKLMMTGAPVVGQEFMILAKAEVCDVHQNKNIDDVPRISFTLQIKDMDLKAHKEEKKDMAESMYGGAE